MLLTMANFHDFSWLSSIPEDCYTSHCVHPFLSWVLWSSLISLLWTLYWADCLFPVHSSSPGVLCIHVQNMFLCCLILLNFLLLFLSIWNFYLSFHVFWPWNNGLCRRCPVFRCSLYRWPLYRCPISFSSTLLLG